MSGETGLMKKAGRAAVPRLRRADAAEEALRKLVAEGDFHELPGVRFLAEALGVGVPTVSEALKRLREQGWISDRGARRRFVVNREVVERAKTEAEVPAASATRHLLIFTPRDVGASPHEPFWHLVSRIGELLAPDGWTLRVHAVDYGHDKRNRAPWDAVMRTEKPHALIVARGTPWMADWSRGCGVPVFYFGGDFGNFPVPVVGYNTGHVFREALRQLIRLGHRTVAVPILARSSSFVKRLREAAADVMAETGVKIALHTPSGAQFELAGLRTCLEKLWVRQPPTALLLASWYEYLAAQGFLAQKGLRVPEDVSLVSLVDDAMSSWMIPEPARFEHDAERLSVVLADWVRKPPLRAVVAPRVLLHGRWIPGASVGPPPPTEGPAVRPLSARPAATRPRPA